MNMPLEDYALAEKRQGRYQAVSRLATLSVVMGMLSVLTPVHWLVGIVPVVGMALGRLALFRIGRNPDELTGRTTARLGFWLSFVFLVLGYGWMTFRAVREVPPGYTRITYDTLQPGPRQRIAPAAYELEDKKVFVKGYIQPGRQQARLKAFILCPVISNCNFCPTDPKPTEMIQIELEGDLEIDYTTRVIHVGGTFGVDLNSFSGVPYQISVDYLK